VIVGDDHFRSRLGTLATTISDTIDTEVSSVSPVQQSELDHPQVISSAALHIATQRAYSYHLARTTRLAPS
jgi:hypothetical protein